MAARHHAAMPSCAAPAPPPHPPPCPPGPACPAADESGQLRVTLEFVQGMLQAFKDEQLIHRRYAFEIILQVGRAAPFPPVLQTSTCA